MNQAMSWFKRIAALLPAPIMAWLNKWLGLLEGTGLSHPHWRQQANNITLAISVLLVLVLFVVFRRTTEQALKKIVLAAFVLSIVALAACVLMKRWTAAAMTMIDIEMYKSYWQLSYVVMAVVWLAAVTLIAMYLARHATTNEK